MFYTPVTHHTSHIKHCGGKPAHTGVNPRRHGEDMQKQNPQQKKKKSTQESNPGRGDGANHEATAPPNTQRTIFNTRTVHLYRSNDEGIRFIV